MTGSGTWMSVMFLVDLKPRIFVALVAEGQTNGNNNIDQNVAINTRIAQSDLEANTESSSVEGSSKSNDNAEISITKAGQVLNKNQDHGNLNLNGLNCT